MNRSDLAGRLRALTDGLTEFYQAPYRRTWARMRRDEDDLFMMLVLGEALGLPNPVGHHTMELLPIAMEEFHDWHTRMGMERSPLDSLSCC